MTDENNLQNKETDHFDLLLNNLDDENRKLFLQSFGAFINEIDELVYWSSSKRKAPFSPRTIRDNVFKFLDQKKELLLNWNINYLSSAESNTDNLDFPELK